ncbi:hypothetical protein D3C87_1828770 [compost metagenome]
MPFDHRLDGGVHRICIAVVGANGERVATGLFDLANQRVGLCLRLTIGDRDNGALACQPPGDRRPNATSATRYQSDLAVQTRHIQLHICSD